MSRPHTGQPGHNRDMSRRWLFADQLGPHFLDDPRQPVLLIESKAVFRRRRLPPAEGPPGALRAAAPRRRTRRPGRSSCAPRRTREALTQGRASRWSVCHPTSRRALEFVRGLDRVDRAAAARLRDQPARTSPTGRTAPAARCGWRTSTGTPGERHGVLMDGDEPAGGRWNLDTENREPPPQDGAARRAGAADADGGRHRRARSGPTWTAGSGEGDQVRRPGRPAAVPGHPRGGAWPGCGTSSGTGSPRSARTRTRCSPTDPWLAHSLLSRLVQPGPARPAGGGHAAPSRRTATGGAPLASVEGFVRQLIGWRDYIWHLYWYFEPGYAEQQRAGRAAGRCRPGSPTWTPTRSRRTACPTCSPGSATAAGCTTSRG